MTKTDTELLTELKTALDELDAISYDSDDDSAWVSSGYNQVSVIEISGGTIYSGYGYYDNSCNHWDIQTNETVSDIQGAIEYLVNESNRGDY